MEVEMAAALVSLAVIALAVWIIAREVRAYLPAVMAALGARPEPAARFRRAALRPVPAMAIYRREPAQLRYAA